MNFIISQAARSKKKTYSRKSTQVLTRIVPFHVCKRACAREASVPPAAQSTWEHEIDQGERKCECERERQCERERVRSELVGK